MGAWLWKFFLGGVLWGVSVLAPTATRAVRRAPRGRETRAGVLFWGLVGWFQVLLLWGLFVVVIFWGFSIFFWRPRPQDLVYVVRDEDERLAWRVADLHDELGHARLVIP